MTNRLKRFPASFRFVAVTFALIATASLATSAAADPPSAQQVQNAKDRVTQLAQEAHAAQRQLDAINLRANEVAAEYDRELGRLEKLNAELLHTQLTLAHARAQYDAIVAQLNDRARTVFMEGPASDLDFLLGASSFIRSDGPVGVRERRWRRTMPTWPTRSRTRRTCLSAKEQNLESLQAAQQAVVAKVREKQREIADLQRQATAKYNEIASKKAEAEKLAKKLSAQRQAWVNAHFSFSGSPHASVAMPSGMGGHAPGVPGRTAASVRRRVRRAALRGRLSPPRRRRHPGADGHADLRDVRRLRDARTRTGSAGLAVEVHGAPGYTYNAHLSAYSDHSTGTVHAGDVIGYVGDYGRRAGRSAARPLRVPPELVPVGMAGELLRVHGDRERAQPVPAVGGRLRLVRARRLPASPHDQPQPDQAHARREHDQHDRGARSSRRSLPAGGDRWTAPGSPATTT